jgi:hypothetical protein
MVLCRDKGVVPAEDTDPRLRELIDDRRDLCDGVAGKGFSSSLPNSLNSLSNPGCIWRAIMGKWFNRSLKDLTSFFRGMDELAPPDGPAAVDGPGPGRGPGPASCLGCIVAGIIGFASKVPMRGRDMKYTSQGCASKESG